MALRIRGRELVFVWDGTVNAIVRIRAAADTGITFLDTVDIYGSGE